MENIPYDATEQQLVELFGIDGPVKSFQLHADASGKPVGTAVCEYNDQHTARLAELRLHNRCLNGRHLRVSNMQSPPLTPSMGKGDDIQWNISFKMTAKGIVQRTEWDLDTHGNDETCQTLYQMVTKLNEEQQKPEQANGRKRKQEGDAIERQLVAMLRPLSAAKPSDNFVEMMGFNPPRTETVDQASSSSETPAAPGDAPEASSSAPKKPKHSDPDSLAELPQHVKDTLTPEDVEVLHAMSGMADAQLASLSPKAQQSMRWFKKQIGVTSSPETTGSVQEKILKLKEQVYRRAATSKEARDLVERITPYPCVLGFPETLAEAVVRWKLHVLDIINRHENRSNTPADLLMELRILNANITMW